MHNDFWEGVRAHGLSVLFLTEAQEQRQYFSEHYYLLNYYNEK